MLPNLERDLVFFDIESTGLNVLRDRIVQIALIKIFKDGRSNEELEMRINPGIPISAEASSIHGIWEKDVVGKPKFEEVAPILFEFIGEADLGGYNSNRFDVPMLMEEFARVGLDLDIQNRRLIDVQRVFYKMEPRTLAAAYRFYCNGAVIENAHDALEDVRATVEVFKGQLDMYEGQDLVDEDGNSIPKPIQRDVQVIHDFINDLKFVDATQRLRIDNTGKVFFNFGKYINREVAEVLNIEPNYAHWILDKEFSVQVKNYIRSVMKKPK